MILEHLEQQQHAESRCCVCCVYVDNAYEAVEEVIAVVVISSRTHARVAFPIRSQL